MSETAEQLCAKLVDHYQIVERERMEGVPILNKTLSVMAKGFDVFGDYRLGIMATPWFMNLMMVPLEGALDDRADPKFGATQHHMLPSGRFAFIVGHEEGLGYILTCSLFSPVFEFADQQAFEETAQAVLVEVLTPAQTEEEAGADEEALADAEMREIWAGRLPAPEPEPEPEPEAPELQGEEGHGEEHESSKDERPKRKLPSLSSKMSRRDVLRGLRAPENEPEDLPENRKERR